MRGKKSLFILVLTVIFSLVSCGAPNNNTIPSVDTAIVQEIFNLNTPKFQTAVLQEKASLGSGNQQAFYQLEPLGEDAYLIVVIDYASRQKAYLCTDPSCKHDGETCTAWVAREANSYSTIVASEDVILLFHHRTLSAPCIEKLNPDGQNKSLLYSFPTGYHLQEGAAYNEKGILVKVSFVSEDASSPSSIQQIGYIDFNEKNYRSVYDIQNASNNLIESGSTELFLREATDNGIILKTIQARPFEEPSLEKMTLEEYTEESIRRRMEATISTLFLLSYQDGQVHELIHYSSGTGRELAAQNFLFYFLDSGDTVPLYKIDLSSGKQTVLIADCSSTVLYSDLDVFSMNDLNPLYFINGQLLIHTLIGEELDAMKNLINTYTLYSVDAQDGSLGEVTLSVFKNASWRPPVVYAEYQDHLLVDVPQDGISPAESYAQNMPLGLISTSDFLSSIPNYQLISE